MLLHWTTACKHRGRTSPGGQRRQEAQEKKAVLFTRFRLSTDFQPYGKFRKTSGSRLRCSG